MRTKSWFRKTREAQKARSNRRSKRPLTLERLERREVFSTIGFDFGQPELWVDNFGHVAGGWNEQQHLRLTGDVNRDGRPDVVGFGNDGVYVSLSTGTSFTQPQRWVDAFGYTAGNWRKEYHPRMLADVNGDGRADIVGFADNGVHVSLSTGTSFRQPQLWVGEFGYTAGGWSTALHPRMLADVNGDGKADVVGFANNGVHVSLSTGTSFAQPRLWVGAFGYTAGGWNPARHIRTLADVNGDGRADVVGFGDHGVYVSLSTGTSFAQPRMWVGAFGYYAGNWREEKHPRMLADVNGDGKADVVGFGGDGVYVSLSTGTSLTSPRRWVANFAYNAGDWRTDLHPRILADINGDGRADIVGFHNQGTHVSLSTGTSFTTTERWLDAFGNTAGGWSTAQHPRMLADVNGDGMDDIVGFSDAGVMVSLTKSVKPGFQIDLVFEGPFSQAQRDAIYDAAQRWSDIIVGDLPTETTPDGFIDDVEILMRSELIDGPSNRLGFGAWTQLRTDGSHLPSRGQITFDTDDLPRALNRGILSDLAFHEIGHVLGFGTIWGNLELIGGAGTADPRFLGASATGEYNSLFGDTDSGVPLENTGTVGGGTRDVHWRDSVFGDEMMTGWIGDNNTVSRITIAAFRDMGYVVDLSRAEAYAPGGGAAILSPGTSSGSGASSREGTPWNAAHAETNLSARLASLHSADHLALNITDRAIGELTRSDSVLKDQIRNIDHLILSLTARYDSHMSGNHPSPTAQQAADGLFADDSCDLIDAMQDELLLSLS